MKKGIAGLIRFLIIIVSFVAPVLVFKLDGSWTLAVLFTLNFAIIGSGILMGTPVVIGVFVLLGVSYIIAIMKAIGVDIAPMWPIFVELAITIISFILVKKSEDFNQYYISSISDELKELEAENDAMLIEKKNVGHALEGNKIKLEKYEKLHEIHESVREFKIFSDKMRYILRNIIYIFHKEQSVHLFLIKENKTMKIMADKEEDMLVGERDQESLFLKNFDEWAIHNKQSIIISDMHKEMRFKTEGQTHIRSLIGVPVLIKDEVVGLIRVVSGETGVFHQEDLRFLDLVAGMISKVLEVENYAK